MKLNEAYNILGIAPSSTPEEAKKQYRKLTKEFHPDINKEPDAEEKFKKINEAYQVVSSGKSTDREDLQWQSSGFNPFGKQSIRQVEDIQLHTTISFVESVLGSSKDIKIQRKNKCKDCEGQGQILLNNGCTKCNGRGQVVVRQGNMVIMQSCDKCHGRSQKESCKVCSGAGVLSVESSVNVTIPSGVVNGNILRLSGMGNYAGSFMTMDQYSDAFLFITVIPEEGLKIEGKDVVYTLEISLLDALKGCRREVNTIKGKKEIEIPTKSRNKNEILIPNLGVGGYGNQRVILDVQYPEDVSQIIEILNKASNYKVN